MPPEKNGTTTNYSNEDPKVTAFAGADMTDEDLSGLDRGDSFIPTDDDDDEYALGDDAAVGEPEGEPEGETEDAPEGETEDAPEGEPEGEPEGDPEAEPEADPEAEPEAKPEGEPEGEKRREPFIPRQRFDQVVRSNQKLKDELQRAQDELARMTETGTTQEAGATAVTLTAEMTEQQRQINEMVLDGKLEEAAAAQSDLNQKMIIMAVEASTKASQTAMTESMAREAYNKTLSKLETDFPFINPEAEGFDSAMSQRVITLSRGLIHGEGYSPAEALEEAVTTLAARYYPDMLKDPGSPASSANPGERTPVKPAAGDTAAAVKRKVAVAGRQPPASGGARTSEVNANRPSLKNLTEAEFEAITEQELQRLRGDFVD